MPSDLHIHTTFSDGQLTPEEVVTAAKAAGLSYIAITDHDNVDGIRHLYEQGLYPGKGIRIIPGIEFSSLAEGHDVHILGYNINIYHQGLLDRLNDVVEGRWARFSKILCRVLPPMSEGQEQAAVIEANRQRVKSNALLADEAEKLTAAYIKRREAGEELPGRIRVYVAEALQVKATKVANLSAIKNGLKVPGLVERWKRNEIPEAAALLIARMDLDEQYRLLDWIIDKRRSLTINEVRKFSTCYTMACRSCEHTGRMCENAERMYDHDYRYGAWLGSNCCLHCLKRDTCPAACQYVKKKPVEEPEKPPLNQAVKDPRLDYKVMVPTFCQRVRALREQTGMSRKEFAQSIDEFPGTYSACENASMCGSEKIAKLALCFGVSTDYLYGLTDDPTPSAQKGADR